MHRQHILSNHIITSFQCRVWAQNAGMLKSRYRYAEKFKLKARSRCSTSDSISAMLSAMGWYCAWFEGIWRPGKIDKVKFVFCLLCIKYSGVRTADACDVNARECYLQVFFFCFHYYREVYCLLTIIGSCLSAFYASSGTVHLQYEENRMNRCIG